MKGFASIDMAGMCGIVSEPETDPSRKVRRTGRTEIVPTVRRIGGTRIEFTADDFIAAFRAFDAVTEIASAEQTSPSMCSGQIPI